MKLKLNNGQLLRRLAYFEYSQRCLSGEIIEIPLNYKEWSQRTDQKAMEELLKNYVE